MRIAILGDSGAMGGLLGKRLDEAGRRLGIASPRNDAVVWLVRPLEGSCTRAAGLQAVA